jgi:hypothetical protein
VPLISYVTVPSELSVVGSSGNGTLPQPFVSPPLSQPLAGVSTSSTWTPAPACQMSWGKQGNPLIENDWAAYAHDVPTLLP